jgi:hypothetical protein
VVACRITGPSRRQPHAVLILRLAWSTPPLQVSNNGGITFKYYFSQDVTVTITSGSVALAGPFTGVMRIAVISSSLAPLGVLSSVNPAAQEAAYDANVGERTVILWHQLRTNETPDSVWRVA